MYFVLLCCTMGGCRSDEIVAPQDLFGEYDGIASGFNGFVPPVGVGNCTGVGVGIDNIGKNDVNIFGGCNCGYRYSYCFDNLRLGKTTVDTVKVTDFRYGSYTLKGVTYGLFDKTSGKQVAYIAYEKRGTATNPPFSYNQTYYLYIPFIISSNTKDTLTHYFGRRMLKEVTQ